MFEIIVALPWVFVLMSLIMYNKTALNAQRDGTVKDSKTLASYMVALISAFAFISYCIYHIYQTAAGFINTIQQEGSEWDQYFGGTNVDTIHTVTEFLFLMCFITFSVHSLAYGFALVRKYRANRAELQ